MLTVWSGRVRDLLSFELMLALSKGREEVRSTTYQRMSLQQQTNVSSHQDLECCSSFGMYMMTRNIVPLMSVGTKCFGNRYFFFEQP